MRKLTIELLLRSRLVKDALASVAIEAGFSVSHEVVPGAKDTIALIDFDDCADQEVIGAHQRRGAKLVVLAHVADTVEVSPDAIVPLSGFLTYDLSAAAFMRCLRLICCGERVLPNDLALGKKAPGPSPNSESRFGGDHLSPREKEILSHVVEGDSNKKIARHLNIAEATVKVHLKSVLRKIRVENRTQAAIWALSNLPGRQEARLNSLQFSTPAQRREEGQQAVLPIKGGAYR
jgi:two-component system, NarL family, nitrate/nitrite response regulator NarL